MFTKSRLFLILAISQMSLVGATTKNNGILKSSKSEDVGCIQVRVADQFKSKLGNALCGLEALYNGLIIAKTTTSPDPQETIKLLANSRHQGTRKDTFTEWKRIVGISRTQNSLRKGLEKRLLGLMVDKGGTKAKRDYLRYELGAIASLLLGKQYEQTDTSITYKITGEKIRNCILERLEIRKKDENRPVTISEDEIDTYFNLNKVKFEISGHIKASEWVISEEIDAIVKYSEYTRNLSVPVFHVADGISAAYELKDDAKLGTNKSFQKFKKKFQSKHGDCRAIFLIYTKDESLWNSLWGSKDQEERASSSDNGHWYSVVANKVGNTRQYILADSASNDLRLSHNTFLELADILEGDVISSDVAEESTRQIVLPESQIVGLQPLSAKKTFARKAKKLITGHPILTGVVVGLVSLFVLNKYMNSKNSSYAFRTKNGSDGHSDSKSPYLISSPSRGAFHEAYNIP